MAMIDCKHCGKPVSAKAESCPHCHKALNQGAMGNCRVCGERLPRKVHRSMGYSSIIVQGTTSGNSYVVHRACTKCGEPKPLFSIWDTPLVMLLLVGFGIPAALFWILGVARGGKEGGLELVCVVGLASWMGVVLTLHARNRGTYGIGMLAVLGLLGLIVVVGVRTAWGL